MKITKHMWFEFQFDSSAHVTFVLFSSLLIASFWKNLFPFFPVTHEIRNKPRYTNHQIKNAIDSKNKQLNVHYSNFFFFCFVATAFSYRKAQKILRKEHSRILFNQIQYNYMDVKLFTEKWLLFCLCLQFVICCCCCM